MASGRSFRDKQLSALHEMRPLNCLCKLQPVSSIQPIICTWFFGVVDDRGWDTLRRKPHCCQEKLCLLTSQTCWMLEQTAPNSIASPEKATAAPPRYHCHLGFMLEAEAKSDGGPLARRRSAVSWCTLKASKAK